MGSTVDTVDIFRYSQESKKKTKRLVKKLE